MHFGIFVTLSVVILFASAQNLIPAGFIPLPPLPVKTNVQPASTAKVTPKPTFAPITKKPTTTKAPWKPSTPKPSLPPSSHLPPSRTVPLATAKPPCGLNINVPSANCKGGNSAVQQTLNTLKQELDKTRQQHQAQSAAVQAMVTKLQTQQAGYLTKISDLQNEVQNLVTAFNSLSGSRPMSTQAPVTPGSGIPSSFLQQEVQNVRNDMNQAVRDINTKVFNLSSLMLSNQQQDSNVHQSIESQIQQQARDLGRLSQQVIDLNKLLQQLKSSTGAAGAGATSADVAKLQAQINKVAADIQAYDKTQQSQFGSLNLQVSSLLTEVNNHTSQMRGLKTSLLVDQSRIANVDKEITVVHDALAQFRKTSLPRMNQLESDVKGLSGNVSSVQTSVRNVGSTVYKLANQIGQDENTLKSLETQTNQLQKDVAKIQGNLNSQQSEINSIKNGMTSLKNAIPINDLNQMNNNILQILNDIQQGKTPSKTQLQSLTQAITTITNKLGNLGVSGSSSG